MQELFYAFGMVLLLFSAGCIGPSLGNPPASAYGAQTPPVDQYNSPSNSQTPALDAQTQTPPPANATVRLVDDPKLGQILTDNQGMTLYVFAKDQTNASNCNGACATIWPPLIVFDGAVNARAPGSLGVVSRSDGSMQVTYNGMPLYSYAKDKAPGDTNGEGFNNLWFVAQSNLTSVPAPAANSAQQAASP